jgi:hypothetical protein
VGTDETGQTVVERIIVSVVKCPILAGQLVTVSAQDVTVYTLVVRIVDVVNSTLDVPELTYPLETAEFDRPEDK